MLSIRNLHVSYGSTRALRGLSLEVFRGEVVCVLGPNGAGKSTLMLTVSGLVRADKGDICLEGAPIHRLSPVEVTQRGVVHCPEGRRLFEALTVGENLKLGAVRRRKSWRLLADDVNLLSELFPILRERWSQRAGTLSGGEQQMVALARSLIAHPRVLLLDEPALGLAPHFVRKVFSSISAFAGRGMAIVLVEQNVHAALRVADRGYLLANGTVSAQGPSDEIGTLLENEGFWGAASVGPKEGLEI